MDGVLTGTRLSRGFFARRAPVVARALIGKMLIHSTPDGRAGGMVVETEAYDPDDPASHAFRGKTVRNAAMFGPAGHGYVYFTYGAHFCFNVVCASEGVADAVLIRAVEPMLGIALMQRRRGTGVVLRNLARGPGRLTQALGIDRRLDGIDLCRGPLGLFTSLPARRPRIVVGPRIGISRGKDTPWRFFASGSRFVSATRPLPRGTGLASLAVETRKEATR